MLWGKKKKSKERKASNEVKKQQEVKQEVQEKEVKQEGDFSYTRHSNHGYKYYIWGKDDRGISPSGYDWNPVPSFEHDLAKNKKEIAEHGMGWNPYSLNNYESSAPWWDPNYAAESGASYQQGYSTSQSQSDPCSIM